MNSDVIQRFELVLPLQPTVSQKFIVLICFVSDKPEQVQYDLVSEVAETLLSQSQFNLFKFALALRMYSPTVEMYNQVSMFALQ